VSARVDRTEVGQVETANTMTSMRGGGVTSAARGGECAFCLLVPAPRYTCPRCAAPYCSLRCYRAPSHVSCAEAFYEGEVKAETALRAVEDGARDSRSRMMATLAKQASEEAVEVAQGEEELDSDDEPDLAIRLSAVDLDDADQVWSNLSADERRDFERLVQTGDIFTLVPEFSPWWLKFQKKANKKKKSIQIVGETDNDSDGGDIGNLLPEVERNIPTLTSITSKKPNAAVAFSMLNALYAYCYGVRFFGEDYGGQTNADVFAALVLDLSASLGSAAAFSNADFALEAAAQSVISHSRWATSSEMVQTVKQDVAVLVNHGQGVVLAALSDLHRTLLAGAALLSSKRGRSGKVAPDAPLWMRQERLPLKLKASDVKKSAKKVLFYLAWTREKQDDDSFFSLLPFSC